MTLPLKYKGKAGAVSKDSGLGQVVKGAWSLPWPPRAPPTALEVALDTAAAREENETQDGCHTELLGCVT